MSMHHHQPTPAPAVRAPHADPFGQFRGAPLNRGRRARYSSLVFGLVLLLSGLPFLLDASLPARDISPSDAEEVMETQVVTYEDWRLGFGELDEHCEISRNIMDMTVASFECGKWSGRMTGMAGVPAYDEAVATALSRSVRVMTFSETGDMGAHNITDEALKLNPSVLDDTGAQDVWMSDPYKTSTQGFDGANGQSSPVQTHYAVGMFKADPEDDAHGMLVTVEVSADGLDAAHEIVEKLLETATVHSGGAEGVAT